MALSVSSFPDNICLPTPGDGLNSPSEPAPSHSAKKRRLFGNLFGKEGSPLFRAPRRQHSESFTSTRRGNNAPAPNPPPTMSISAQNASAEVVLDLAAPSISRVKPRLPALAVPSSSHLPPPSQSPSDTRDLVFPPTPTAAEHDRSNLMKESIKALRLSRIHRPIDWARKPEDDALPPWASRGVIASFGNPDQYPPGDGDRNRMSSGTTSSSGPSTASPRASTRPSVASSSSPSSRTSSVSWSTATAATSPASSTSKSRNARPRTPSDTEPGPSNAFRPASTSSSSKSTRSAKAAPPAQLSGTATMRLRSLSTASDKGKAAATSPLATPSPTDLLHKRTRSNASDDHQNKTRPLPLPTGLQPRPRARTLSGPEVKSKPRQKVTSPGVRPLPTVGHAPSPGGTHPRPPPVPPLSASPISSRPGLVSRAGSTRGTGTVSGPRSRPTTPSSRPHPPTRSRPTTPSRSAPTVAFPGKHAPSPIQSGPPTLGHKPSLPSLNSLPAPALGRNPSLPNIHAPTPVVPPAPPPFLPGTSPASAPPRVRTGSFGISRPSVWGPPSGSRRPSVDPEEARRGPVVIVTTRDGRGSEQETDGGAVIRKMRDLKMNR